MVDNATETVYLVDHAKPTLRYSENGTPHLGPLSFFPYWGGERHPTRVPSGLIDLPYRVISSTLTVFVFLENYWFFEFHPSTIIYNNRHRRDSTGPPSLKYCNIFVFTIMTMKKNKILATRINVSR